jgi:hypothetical protein
VRDIEADLCALRIQLHVRVEAVRAHEVAQLDGLLCGRTERLGSRILGEEMRLCGGELVRRVGGEVGEDLDWAGALAGFVRGEASRRKILQKPGHGESTRAGLHVDVESQDLKLFARRLCLAWYHSRPGAAAEWRRDSLLCTARQASERRSLGSHSSL